MLKGILIGIGMILPGVSGGVIAVILGVYDKIIYSLSNFFSDYKKNARFLIPLFIGMGIGAIISAKILIYIFNKYFIESCYLFIGLITGSMPFLIKEGKEKDKNKINYFLLTFTFILSFIVTVFFKNNLNLSQELSNNFESFFKLFITGIIFISGKIIPGLSSSCMLMMIGMYSYYINIMSNPLTYTLNNPIQMIFIILGIIVGAVIFIKLMNYLLNIYYSTTYSLIIGFVLGSLIVMYPNTINITGILTLFIGILVSYYFSTYLRK